MRRSNLVTLVLLMASGSAFGQNKNFSQLEFLFGKWSGTGTGFGNETSVIKSEFKSIMNGQYIEVVNDSKFKPTEKKLDGEHHIDKGIISFDKSRQAIVYRQFNIEGYVNHYILNNSLSSDTALVFETEIIENFMPGGKAKYTIVKLSNNRIETIFDLSLPGKEYACFGKNILTKIK